MLAGPFCAKDCHAAPQLLHLGLAFCECLTCLRVKVTMVLACEVHHGACSLRSPWCLLVKITMVLVACKVHHGARCL